MPRRICIECHHAIVLPTPKQKLCAKCRRIHAVIAHSHKSKSSTRTARGPAAPRPKRKVNLNFSDIMHAPEGKAADWINRILAGEMSVTG